MAQAHIHDLLFHHHARQSLDYIFFPCITHLPTPVEGVMESASCPIVAGAPKVVEAAFTKELDFFARAGVEYVAPAATLVERNYFKRQMFDAWGERLRVTRDESDHACEQGFAALERFDREMERRGLEILERIEEENRVALLLLARPYHNDPGLNHGVLEDFQALGYPILTIRSIPKDPAWLERFFRDDLERGVITSPLRDLRRLAGELLLQQRAEGVGGQVRGPPPQRRGAGPVELQMRQRRTHLRSDRQHRLERPDALLGLARPRRQQARRLAQDPGRDLRPHARAASAAPRRSGRAQERARAAGADQAPGAASAAEAGPRAAASRQRTGTGRARRDGGGLGGVSLRGAGPGKLGTRGSSGDAPGGPGNPSIPRPSDAVLVTTGRLAEAAASIARTPAGAEILGR